MSHKEKIDTTEVWEGPGAILRRKREAKGLDVPAVARMLHLSEKKLKALEADDFDLLPEPVYVRGYLKNYARFLDEPVAPILDAYARLKPTTTNSEQPLLDSHVVEDLGGNGHDMVRVVSILVVVVVIALPVFWWWDYLGLAVEKIAGKVVQSDEKTMPTSDSSNNGSGLSGFVQPPPQVSSGTGTETSSPASEDNSGQISEPLKLQSAEQPESKLTEAPTDSPSGMTIQPTKPEVTEEVKSTPIPTPVATINTPSLAAVTKETEFEFIESSWVKVRDNNDQVVLIGEYKKGETKRLSGIHAPYKVVLGNSKAVRVKIDGEPVNIERFSNGGVSRFTINDGKIENP